MSGSLSLIALTKDVPSVYLHHLDERFCIGPGALSYTVSNEKDLRYILMHLWTQDTSS